MIRLYAMIFVIALLGGAAYAAKYYYDTTQATIAQLRENNAKLEVANEENQQTIKKMGEDAIRLNALTDQLNACLLYTSPSPRDSMTSRMPSSA